VDILWHCDKLGKWPCKLLLVMPDEDWNQLYGKQPHKG
jgi:hypothetical protein